MDRDEDFPSDSEQSDDDYNPEEHEEAASGDEYGDDQHLSSDEKPNSTTTLKTLTKIDELKETTTEKDKSDALWADFLSDTDVNKRPSTGSRVVPCTESIPPRKDVVTKLDTIEGENVQGLIKHDKIVREKVGVAKILDVLAKPAKLPRGIPSGISTFSNSKRRAGLSSVLGQIGKKAKVSTLEKTKLDWNNFKKSEGIDEQLTTHNKGKEGYLERQDFFQRTDLRQFEIEKQLRQTKRSNR